jgi:3-oxo-5-alpha-steroid 4-dehydrogenase 3 / polyprenol reductase
MRQRLLFHLVEVSSRTGHSDIWSVVWCTIYLLLSIAAVTSRYTPSLSDLARHGKTRQEYQQQHYYQRVTVPKAWFRHFYLVGLATAVVFIVLEWPNTITHDDDQDNYNNNTTTVGWTCAMVLLLAHLLRRCYECYHVHRYGNSRMHLAGYVVGILHYAMLPWNFTKRSQSSSMVIMTVIGVSLCVYGQYEQHMHHVILSRLRTKDAMYAIPQGRWFVYVSCPHYLAEIIIYTGLVIILIPNLRTCALLAWVVTNLTVSAWNSHQWYLDTFGDEYAALRRKAIVPFVM